MKIKTQLRIFLIGVILVPILAALTLPAYHYLTRPERMLFDGYKQVRKLGELPLSQRDIGVFKQLLHTLPPNVEFIIVDTKDKEKDFVLANTMSEFKGKSELAKGDIFRHMNETSDDYFYQFVSPPIEDKRGIMFVSRTQREQNNSKKNSGFERTFRTILIFIAIFEVFSILIILNLTQTITRSITILDRNTQKIANGELDVKLDYEKDSKTNNEITSLTGNLEKMRLALKDNEERRTRFIMGISHDLRTPVAVIKGYTEAMSDGFYEKPDEMKKTLEIISTKTDQLETMINTLINFVKLNQTDWLGQLKKQKIAPFIREFAQTSVTTGGVFRRKVSADINLSDDLEIPFDRELVQRAMENIFSNALRYTNENDTVLISAFEKDGTIQISIKDSGIGMEQKDMEKIFEMFYRASSSRREEGMGVGLATVMTIIKAHGWKIAVDSQLKKGSEFTITIPVN